ncbi:hypothetical protein FGB62_13g219 [Gracilaria domingensis]|nr:hypothetical protein FGB62_13g219 [Gracilaria domingensis]
MRQLLRSRVRDAIKLRCIKPNAIRKQNSCSSASKSTVKSSKSVKPLAHAAAAAAAARATNAAATVPPVVSPVPSDMSLEDRVHRLFRAHRFMLRESEKILAHMRVAYENDISPILSDDDMDDDRDQAEPMPNGGVNGGGNGGGNGANRTVLNVAN